MHFNLSVGRAPSQGSLSLYPTSTHVNCLRLCSIPLPMVSPLVTRRNGKTQACEPCRRRKVACDHGYPVCRRCRRRPNGETACYYASPDQEIRTGESSVAHKIVNGASFPEPWSVEASFQSNRHVGPEDRIWSSPAARAPLGFFGPTSFPAAYLETETNLSTRGPLVAAEALSDTYSPSIAAPPSPADIQAMVNMDQGASYLAVRVLQAIPEKPTFNPFRSRTDVIDEWVAGIAERLVMSTWETYGSYLRDRGNVLKLRELGSMICINTRKRINEDQDDSLAWVESFSGPNLRWEAVGIMFLYTALGQSSASTSADSGRLLDYYTEYCSSCITLANMGGSSGSLMLFLLYKRSMLHASMHGETSKRFSPGSRLMFPRNTKDHSTP